MIRWLCFQESDPIFLVHHCGILFSEIWQKLSFLFAYALIRISFSCVLFAGGLVKFSMWQFPFTRTFSIETLKLVGISATGFSVGSTGWNQLLRSVLDLNQTPTLTRQKVYRSRVVPNQTRRRVHKNVNPIGTCSLHWNTSSTARPSLPWSSHLDLMELLLSSGITVPVQPPVWFLRAM